MSSEHAHIPPDRRRCWSVSAAALLAGVAVLALLVSGDQLVTRTDAAVVRAVAEHRPAWLVDVARVVTWTGHGAPLALLLVVTCAALTATKRLPRRAAALPLLAWAIAGALNPLLKAIVDRPRPPEALRAATESSSGFPSGHAAQSASAWIALALVLWLYRRPSSPPPRAALAGLLALVATIGITRVILAVHSPTDVLAGWAWGAAVALIVVGAAARTRTPGAGQAASPGAPSADDRPPPEDHSAGATGGAPEAEASSATGPAASRRCATTIGAKVAAT